MSNNLKPLSEQIAAKLIQQLQDGNSVFQKNDGPPLVMPFNAGTGKNYSGVPALILLLKQEPDPRWMTLEQGNFRKNNVMKGEKGTLISFYKNKELQPLVEDGKPVLNEKGKPQMTSVKLEEPKLTNVFLFNAKQLKDMPELATVMAERAGALPEDRLKSIIENSGHGPGASLRDIAEKLISEKPNESSVKDALKANIAALFMSAQLQVPFDIGDHTGYAKPWQQLLKDEPAELFKAANDAQRLADKIIGFEKKRAVEQTTATSLNKGDVIAYNGDTIKVLNILKGNTAQVQNSHGDKFKVSPKDGLYTSLVNAKNTTEQAVVRDLRNGNTNDNDNQQQYATGR